ncbi:DUF4292 domain-containing protein [Patiriisocius hiemis]|uniref:DUF4292 domain-containing protein n=1 Tax=Patiriisocius hiemis TaxID=3075604 RepID=A0ABU2YBF8_9FLAO|nr:DUF4292 domain-containing protein [Constantimarinum sp. W242]MDT0555534.1 DUF4292 domain-containing protein [Constantimarinum sp. W242]
MKCFASVLLLALLVSCKGTKQVASTTADASATVKNVMTSHNAALPDFKTLAGRVQVVYEDDNKLQSITASIRMEKDKKIWIKASILGITLAKVLITPERVSYYETVGNSYFDGDFELLSSFLGTEIDFEKAQAILLGQTIFSINPSKYTSAVVTNKYRIQPKVQPQNFIHSLFLEPTNFKVYSQTISQPEDNRVLSVKYNGYDEIEGGYYPSEIMINATQKEGESKIELNYKKIDLNVSISFPFTIPDGYTKIDL